MQNSFGSTPSTPCPLELLEPAMNNVGSRETRSTCPYCGVGCGVIVQSHGAQISGVRGDPEHPANFGRLCTKGSTLHLTAAAHLQPQLRALRPMRRAGRDQPLMPVSWDTALDEVAGRFAAIVQRSGPNAVGLPPTMPELAFYSTLNRQM